MELFYDQELLWYHPLISVLPSFPIFLFFNWRISPKHFLSSLVSAPCKSHCLLKALHLGLSPTTPSKLYFSKSLTKSVLLNLVHVFNSSSTWYISARSSPPPFHIFVISLLSLPHWNVGCLRITTAITPAPWMLLAIWQALKRWMKNCKSGVLNRRLLQVTDRL